MDLAKSSIQDFLKSLPPSANVGLRVLGHKGSGADKDKELSCSQTELVYGLEPYNEGKFNGVLNSFAPKGWTGIAKALEEAQKDLSSKQGSGVKNIIYLVSDGIETCGGDPVSAAKTLHQSNVAAVVNIIGFDVDNQAQQQLKSVAEAGGGSYVTVNDAASLKKAFKERINELRKMNEKWRNKALEDIWNDYKKYKDLNYKAYEEINKARYREYDHLIAAKEYLFNTKKITLEVSADLNSNFISKRLSLLGTYSSNKLKENSRKIEEQANWDEVRNQFNKNNNKINEFEKNGN